MNRRKKIAVLLAVIAYGSFLIGIFVFSKNIVGLWLIFLTIILIISAICIANKESISKSND